MKFATEYLWFNTSHPRDYINVTEEIGRIVRQSGIQEGMVLVSAMHITAGVYVNDAESGIIQDIDEWADRVAPKGPDYHHHRTGESNGDAHLKSLLLHHEVVVPITGGDLDLGPWQQIYYAEFDGQRRKRVVVKAMGE
ncbi:MAG: secondary thiamine-phosphate synthase enzyme YjbQ [Armatimonadota bacterium]|nr:secondary thiamine-phosphate synthase enzyme YjbQ [Armatimonadota bacterium]